MTRLGGVFLALFLLATACADPDSEEDAAPPPASSSTEAPGTTTTPGSLPTGPSALDDPLSPQFPDPLVEVSEIRSGGPPPDGIPSIDEPQFISQEAGDAWLIGDESVVVVEVSGDARAYPAQILIWHEIVNDVIGGLPVVVTYCPLCNSAVAYERSIDGVVTTFGTSGKLYNSALVMYDRATESLWTHYDGRAVVGLLAGQELELIPAPLMAWRDFKAAYPAGVVLDRDATGHVRDYGRNPYVGYDDPDGNPFLFRGTVDDRTTAMQRVVGVTVGGESAAWALGAISSPDGDAAATNTDLGGQPIVILWKSGQRSALDGIGVDEGRDVGSVGVFSRVIDGQELTFDVEDGGFVDPETGTTWSIAGQATEGPLAGTSLERISHLDTFWFAWSTYTPGTTLIEG